MFNGLGMGMASDVCRLLLRRRWAALRKPLIDAQVGGRLSGPDYHSAANTGDRQHGKCRFLGAAFCSGKVQSMPRLGIESNFTHVRTFCSPFKAERMARPRGVLWRTRKSLSREAQTVVREMTRHMDDKERLAKIVKQDAGRLLKMDMLAVLKELQREGKPELACMIFDLVKKESWYKPDIFMYRDMMVCLVKFKLTSEAEKMFEESKEAGIEPELNLYTELLRALIFSKQVDKVHKVVAEMKELGCHPDLAVYKVLWIGLTSIGRNKDAMVYKHELSQAQHAYATKAKEGVMKQADEIEM